MPKSKSRLKPSADLTPRELKAIERFESGKGKYVNFDNVKDAIKWLNEKNTKRK